MKTETSSPVETGNIIPALLEVFYSARKVNADTIHDSAITFMRESVKYSTVRDVQATIIKGSETGSLEGIKVGKVQHFALALEIHDTVEGAKALPIGELLTLALRGNRGLKGEALKAIEGQTVETLRDGDESKGIAPIFPPSNPPKPRATREGLEFGQILSLITESVKAKQKNLKTNKGALLLDESEKTLLIGALEALATIARANAIVKAKVA